MKWQGVVPVLVSIFVIIVVAIVQRYSKLVAGIAATMPLNIPLAMWVVSASTGGDAEGMRQFTQSLLVAIWPTVIFVATAWLAARLGWRVLPAIVAGYVAWGAAWLVLYGLRRF